MSSDWPVASALRHMEWHEVASDDSGLSILRLKGEIDLQHSPQLRELLQAKAGRKIPALLLDFSGVKYIDSSGLATLVEYYQRSRAHSGRLVLAGMSERVRSIFELVRLNEIFEVYPTFEQARAELTAAAGASL